MTRNQFLTGNVSRGLFSAASLDLHLIAVDFFRYVYTGSAACSVGAITLFSK